MFGLDKHRHALVSIFSCGTRWTLFICALVSEKDFFLWVTRSPSGSSLGSVCGGAFCCLPHPLCSLLSVPWGSFWRLPSGSLSFVPFQFCSLPAPPWMLIMQIHFPPLMMAHFLCYLPLISARCPFALFCCVLIYSLVFWFIPLLYGCLFPSQKPCLSEFCCGAEVFLKFLLNPKIDPSQIWLFGMIFVWCANSTPTSTPIPSSPLCPPPAMFKSFNRQGKRSDPLPLPVRQ